ncbi:hypothetical protein NQ315_017259, partial [Exocentrus adspersus]
IKQVVFVILSQENKYHVDLAKNVLKDIVEQSESLYKERPVVHLSYQDFPIVGGWTVLPLIPRLSNLHRENSSWIFFLEDRTKTRLNLLTEILEKYDPLEEIWIGNALHDNEATIIHHFAFYENPKYFKYPNMASGFAFSTALLKRLSRQIEESPPTSDFSIDSSHELALFVWNKGAGQMLRHESALCNREGPRCAAFPSQFRPCADPIPNNSLYFAVKTCQKYHKDRISVVKRTWAKHAVNVKYFSDVKDESVPTVELDVPNTPQGHCGKTMAILRHVATEIANDTTIRWIIVADDDTILSISRFQHLLTCYNASESVALGERYGYSVHSSRGYNYITGGGGMVFSVPLLKRIVEKGICECPSPDTPDDMFLGICIAGLGWELRIRRFSIRVISARPEDYAPGYLEAQTAVSFHKHWMIDPVKVYKEWFEEVDINANTDYFKSIHSEL